MTQVCSQCSRINPGDAAYCYFDGVRLVGSAASGPINAGAQNFPSQFVFPTGQVCRNFDQLALACQQNWHTAVELVKNGYLAGFFGGLGRADLALAAQEAAHFPDQDRGLDQLLAKLPSQVLQSPKLKVEPSDINVGQITIGTDRTIELHLANLGMRLVYGSIASDSKWLTLGEAPGNAQKLFQFGAETTIPLQVRGQHLRAGTKPLEGQLLVESNGGNFTITVRAMVPITPFKEGVLAGSLTPRQIAEKARSNPSVAAPFFEKGDVAQWFQSNGWIYPVQGPSANGLGAVQQFFEALGLAKAPKVAISAQALTLKGNPGQSLQTTLEVTTPEKKPVYAHATCDQPWVDVNKVKLAGRQATITVAIPSVPARPGETLQTNIHVQGNGNQRFTVPLTLTVLGTPGQPPVLSMEEPEPFVALSSSTTPLVSSSPGITTPSTAFTADASAASAPPTGKPERKKRIPWIHAVPLGLLFVALLVLLIRDLMGTPTGSLSILAEGEIDPKRTLAIFYDYKTGKAPKPGEPEIVNNNMNFGLFKLDEANVPIKLFFGEQGRSNSTLIKINEPIAVFGKPGSGGHWVEKPIVKGTDSVAKWGLGNVHITQEVKFIPGDPIEVSPDVFKRFRDICLVKYVIENKDIRTHSVGMRVLLDTYIGMNDGSPFTIPGVKGLMATSKDFKTPDEVPDFILGLEEPNLDNPGTVVQLNLRVGDLEGPSRVMLTRWPGNEDVIFPGKKAMTKVEKIESWEIPLTNIGDDSAVVMYWPPEKLEPGQSRTLGYSYGVGSLANTSGQLAVSVGGSFMLNKELSVVAMVSNAKSDEKVTLKLPPKGFTLVSESDTQAVPPPQKDAQGKMRAVPVTWRVRADEEGAFTLRVETSSGVAQGKRVIIRKTSIF
jgi:hypothetical protein